MRRKPLSPPPKNAAGIRPRHKGRQLRSVLTENGRVRLQRIRWAITGETCTTPIDAMLDRAEKSFTRGVREMLCRLNQSSSSFLKTAKNIGRLASIDISGESVRKLVESEGRAVTKEFAKGRFDVGWSAADCVVEEPTAAAMTSTSAILPGSEVASAKPANPLGKPGKTRIYVGCDGVKVPVVTDVEKRRRRKTIKDKRRRSGRKCRPLPAMRPGADQQYKEARIVTAYDESQTHRLVMTTRGNSETTGRMLCKLGTMIELKQATETIANIDGAPWIRNQLEFHHIVQEINLDYYHLKDNAQKARREMFGSDEAGAAWLEKLMSVLMEEGVDAMLAELVEQRKSVRGRRRKALQQLFGYISERREIIRYRELRERGIQIGSGPTEAQCKTTTQRIKGRGRRWDFENAESMMNLAALDASNLWEKHWENTPNIVA